MGRAKWALGAAVLLVVCVGLVLPDEVEIVRSAVIEAAPAAIHPHLASPRTWPEWSAWNAEADPTVRFSFSGPESGAGAKWGWKGKKFSEGELEVREADPANGLRYVVTMADGFRADGRIAFSSGAAGTIVTWTDRVPLGMGPLGGWMRLFLGGAIDREQGGNQEQSLHGLKRRVEQAGTLERLRSRIPRWYASSQPDSLAQLYAADGMIFSPSRSPVVGKDSIAAYWQRMLKGARWDVALQLQHLQISGPWAVEHGRYGITIRLARGGSSPVADQGHYLVVWHRTDQGWRIRYDFSASAALPSGSLPPSR